MTKWTFVRRASITLVALLLTIGAGGVIGVSQAQQDDGKVHARFGLNTLEEGPFPGNWFTVKDEANLTGLRVDLPRPGNVSAAACELPDTTRPSVCDDLKVLNSLDGFNLQPRVSVPFDGAIKPETATSNNVFLVDIDGGAQDRRQPVGLGPRHENATFRVR